jgi:hypothetical protein
MTLISKFVKRSGNSAFFLVFFRFFTFGRPVNWCKTSKSKINFFIAKTSKYKGKIHTIFENPGFLFCLKKRNFQVHSVRYTKTKTLVITKSFYNLCACLKVAQKFFWNLSKKCEGFFRKRLKREILVMKC